MQTGANSFGGMRKFRGARINGIGNNRQRKNDRHVRMDGIHGERNSTRMKLLLLFTTVFPLFPMRAEPVAPAAEAGPVLLNLSPDTPEFLPGVSPLKSPPLPPVHRDIVYEYDRLPVELRFTVNKINFPGHRDMVLRRAGAPLRPDYPFRMIELILYTPPQNIVVSPK